MIRHAIAADLEQLVVCARTFTGESGLPLTFDERKARDTLWAAIHHADVDFLVDIEGDVLAGAVIVVYEASYYEETCAYVDKLFVHREFRGRGTADNLVNAVLDACEKRGAALVFASATAGMGETVEKLYVRLFKRHGFDVLGRIIMRTI